MNVTGIPLQTGFWEAVMETFTVIKLLVVIDSVLLVIGLLVVQISLDVSVHVTRSPLAGVY